MSGLPPVPPPAPLGLPPPRRGFRALNTLPAVLCGVVVVGVVGLIVYTIFSLSSGPAAVADTDTGSAAAGGAADVLANAPTGNEIAAYRLPGLPQPRRVPQGQGQANVQGADEQPAVDTTLETRKAAWAAYYQAQAEHDRAVIDARRKALEADTEVGEVQDKGGPPGALPTQTAAAGAKDFFGAAASSPDTDYLPFTVTNPISRYELKATDMITAKLVTQLNSDSRGHLKALVTKNVLDHATGTHILIPQGSTLEGTYDTSIGYGQTRTTTAWTRVLYPPPCDQSLDLGAMAGSDQTGQAGFEDLTDNHLVTVFTAAVLVSVFGAAAQLSQPPQSSFSTYSPYQSAAGAVGQQTTQIGAEFARKGLSIAPTEQVRAGYEFGVFLEKDIAFSKPWVAGACEEASVEVASR